MKTNVKSGLFIYGFINVDTAKIKICDANTNNGLTFVTGMDGVFRVYANTDEEGYVEEISIDLFNCVGFESQKEVLIDEDKILVKDGKQYKTYE